MEEYLEHQIDTHLLIGGTIFKRFPDRIRGEILKGIHGESPMRNAGKIHVDE